MISRILFWSISIVLMACMVAVLYHSPDKPGIYWPILILLIGFAITVLSIDLYKPKKTAKRPDGIKRLVSVTSKFLGWFFLPGNEFFSEDMDSAIQKDKDGYLSKIALLLVIAILVGFSLLSPLDLLEARGIISTNWEFSTNPIDWAKVYAWGGVVYMFLTMAINALVKLAILMQSVINRSEKIDSLLGYFQLPDKQPDNPEDIKLFWNTFSQHLDKIFGHKTWGGPKMYELLQQITVNKDKIGTSHWFLLQFAADTLDHHVLNEKVGLTFTYDDDAEYSEFLARSMTYCTKSMIWIVDRSDFDKKLFPSILREVFFSIAYKLDLPKKGIASDLAALKKQADGAGLDKVFPHSEHLCRACNKINGGKPCEAPKDKYVGRPRCRDWNEVLDCYLHYWACRVLENKIADVTSVKTTKGSKGNRDYETSEIWKLCDDRETDRFAYPHLRTYYSHLVPKSRIIDLGHLGGWLGSSTEMKCEHVINRLGQIAWPLENIELSPAETIDKLAAHYIQDVMRCEAFKVSIGEKEPLKSQKLNSQRHCFLEAWKLFKHLSNSGSRQKHVGFAPLADRISSNDSMRKIMLYTHEPGELIDTEKAQGSRMFTDIGVYDKNVMVNSSSDGTGRVVRWSLLPEKVSTFDGVDPENKRDAAELLQLSDFVSYLEETIEVC